MTDQRPSPDTSRIRSLLPWLLVAAVVAALAGGLVVALASNDDDDVARFNREHHAGMPMGGSSSMPHQSGSSIPMQDDDSMPHAGAGAEADGLAASHDGYSLSLLKQTTELGTSALALRLERDGQPVRDLEVQHTKRLHVIVARRDLTGYSHLHPQMRADGTWTSQLTLAEPGPYRVFADFQVDGDKHVLGADLTVPGDYRPAKLPATATSATVDGYRVTVNRDARSGDVRFQVFRDGQPVTQLAQVLGARGHLVALRASDLAYLHTHPDESVTGNRIDFATDFPAAGAYRLFLQFSAGGAIHTAQFTVKAS